MSEYTGDDALATVAYLVSGWFVGWRTAFTMINMHTPYCDIAIAVDIS